MVHARRPTDAPSLKRSIVNMTLTYLHFNNGPAGAVDTVTSGQKKFSRYRWSSLQPRKQLAATATGLENTSPVRDAECYMSCCVQYN